MLSINFHGFFPENTHELLKMLFIAKPEDSLPPPAAVTVVIWRGTSFYFFFFFSFVLHPSARDMPSILVSDGGTPRPTPGSCAGAGDGRWAGPRGGEEGPAVSRRGGLWEGADANPSARIAVTCHRGGGTRRAKLRGRGMWWGCGENEGSCLKKAQTDHWWPLGNSRKSAPGLGCLWEPLGMDIQYSTGNNYTGKPTAWALAKLTPPEATITSIN